MDRKFDWTLLTTQGRGRFVGTQLHIFSPRGGWWGEGDEKFFVDGEKFPSTFGTGSEDYFGYAWGAGNTFSEPFHGQPYTENGLNGHITDFRWHISDNIPFQTGFEGVIEKYFPNDRATLFAAVVYWYLDPAGTDPYSAAPVSERVGYCVRPPVFHEPNAIEAENLKPIGRPPGADARKQDAANSHIPIQIVSNDAYLQFKIQELGQKVDLSGMKVEKAGKYTLLARAFKEPCSGIYQFSIDGCPVGTPLDLCSPKKVQESAQSPDPMISIGQLDLTAGEHVLSLTLVGKNENARLGRDDAYYANLDYLKLEPVK